MKLNLKRIEQKLRYPFPPDPNSVGKKVVASHLDLENLEVPVDLEPL